MKKTSRNPCIRCGTERIVLKTWKEKIDDSIIINVQTACPNPDCQKEVDKDNKKQMDKYMATKLKHEQRLAERRGSKSVKSASK